MGSRNEQGWERSRRRFVPGGASPLEVRVVPSTIGHSTHVGHASVHVGPTCARPASHAADHHARHRVGVAASPTSDRWSWLANTYWYVPTPNLPAVLSKTATGSVIPVSDQTVFQITHYSHGCFWGNVAIELGSSQPSHSTMLGSITPQGRVLLSFTTTSTGSSPSITQGYGQMTRKAGQWTMENQMFTAPGQTLQIGHWAYMTQTRPGLPSWNSLPSAGVSVPTFLGA